MAVSGNRCAQEPAPGQAAAVACRCGSPRLAGPKPTTEPLAFFSVKGKSELLWELSCCTAYAAASSTCAAAANRLRGLASPAQRLVSKQQAEAAPHECNSCASGRGPQMAAQHAAQQACMLGCSSHDCLQQWRPASGANCLFCTKGAKSSSCARKKPGSHAAGLASGFSGNSSVPPTPACSSSRAAREQ